MRYIPLTQGKFAIVDNIDFEWLNQNKWYFNKRAMRTIYLNASVKNRKIKNIYLHNEIMNPPLGMWVDHINHNPLDNRRCNLRICTNPQNQQNRRVLRNNKLGIKGVYRSNLKSKPYRAFIKGKLIGYYTTIREAALAYNEEASRIFGDFACLNKI